MTPRNETRLTSQWYRAVWVGALLLVSASASAKPSVPGLLKDGLDMPCAPPCTICHTTLLGGRGTAHKAFAYDMSVHGFTVDPEPNVAYAITQYETNPIDNDADHDGIDDLTELRQGTDPNIKANGASVCGPEYGCARVARGGVDGIASVCGGLALAAGIAFMRRARKRR